MRLPLRFYLIVPSSRSPEKLFKSFKVKCRFYHFNTGTLHKVTYNRYLKIRNTVELWHVVFDSPNTSIN